ASERPAHGSEVESPFELQPVISMANSAHRFIAAALCIARARSKFARCAGVRPQKSDDPSRIPTWAPWSRAQRRRRPSWLDRRGAVQSHSLLERKEWAGF